MISQTILLGTDPNGLMKAQKVDWHIFGMFTIVVLNFHRTTLQLLRTSKFQKLAEKHVLLIDVLADAKSAILFEKHLIGELANENLLFWREAIKFKLSFDRSNDFEYTQHVAKMIWRTFISPTASFPINISDKVKTAINLRFKSETVGKTVFDDVSTQLADNNYG
jgi:Regulator of G protein signaling domain